MPLDTTTKDDRKPNPFDKYNTPASPILFPVAERTVAWQTRGGDYVQTTSHKALIRVMPNGGPRMLNIVGGEYKLVHNRELFTHVENVLCEMMQGDALNGVQVTDKVAGWGRVCFRQYIFPNIKCKLTRGAKSDIAFRLLVQNGYGGSALRIHVGAIEFYCTNGMIRGEHQSSYRRHTSKLEISGVDKVVRHGLITFAESQVLWQKWANTPVKHQAAMDLFHELANTEKLAEKLSEHYLRERDDRGDNLYAVYSALTYYASHADDSFKLRASVNEQDTVATTMLQRELNVSRWVDSKVWKQLEAV